MKKKAEEPTQEQILCGLLRRIAEALEEIDETLTEINDKLPDKAVSATLELKENEGASNNPRRR